MPIKTDYTVGIICALPLERTAVEAMLDEEHAPLPQEPNDRNTYTFGTIGPHNVIIASLSFATYGTVAASTVAADMRRSFGHIRLGLLVGIAGAMARPTAKGGDIRLGDIVVGGCTGVASIIDYQMGKDTTGGFEIRSELGPPPEHLSTAVGALQTKHSKGPSYLLHLHNMLQANPGFNLHQLESNYYNRPDAPDHLYTSAGGNQPVSRPSRYNVDPHDTLKETKLVQTRQEAGRTWYDYPVVHYGTIASSNTLMKNAAKRDEVYQRVKDQRNAEILCFEMEAAGIVRGWDCLVIRGICDYSDEKKNKTWQNFAAATAAAYAKDLLLRISPEAVKEAKPVNEVVEAQQVNAPTAGGECLSEQSCQYEEFPAQRPQVAVRGTDE